MIKPYFIDIDIEGSSVIRYGDILRLLNMSITPYTTKDYYKEKFLASFNNSVLANAISEIDLSLDNDGYTLFIKPQLSTYHTIFETFAQVYLAKKLFSNISQVVMVDLPEDGILNRASLQYNFLVNELIDEGIFVKEISKPSGTNIKIGKSIFVGPIGSNGITIHAINALIERFAGKSAKSSANKKVYISRKLASTAKDLINDSSRFSDDIRVYDEEVLEKYLYSLGYEILSPENFTTFEEQLEYFSNTSMLISSTNAGLSNMIFMPSGSTVVELKTPLVRKVYNETRNNAIYIDETHDLYVPIAYQKGHLYVSLPVDDRSGFTAVEKLKQLGGISI